MIDLVHHIHHNFSGALIIGDVHSQLDKFRMAVAYAQEHRLLLISLGDLVDSGPHPFETVQLMHRLMTSNTAAFVIGNHDDKFGRYADGRDVIFSNDARSTIDTVGAARMNDFLGMYCEIIHHEFSGIFHRLGNMILTHGAYHSDMDHSLNNRTVAKKCRYRALYGEVTGEKYQTGHPVRAYHWFDEVPPSTCVIVGHDRRPVCNEPISAPMEVDTRFGGRVIFMDTGCGKGGILSGAILRGIATQMHIDSYVTF